MPHSAPVKRVAIIGAGPAGLMAAEPLCGRGLQVELYDSMPSVGRKFLQAGVGGLNLTHAEPHAEFVRRYGARQAEIERWLTEFGPADIRAWAQALGIETFVGSSGRVFPAQMKAAPLLRAWLQRLRASGTRLHVRHRWCGWSPPGALCFETPQGLCEHTPDATVLALGGGSWPRLGSDATWLDWLRERGVEVAPLQPSNCGFELNWSEHLRVQWAGHPLKQVNLSLPTQNGRLTSGCGECMVTAYGLEGGVVYAMSGALREAIARHGHAEIEIDLLPMRGLRQLTQALQRPRGSRSLANHLRRAGVAGIKAALLREVASPADLESPAALAALCKALPLRFSAPRPLSEAISSAGGVRFESLDERLMLRGMPGVFCAGEMLDWEAPTGGYLLTACLASGRVAARGVLEWLAEQ